MTHNIYPVTNQPDVALRITFALVDPVYRCVQSRRISHPAGVVGHVHPRDGTLSLLRIPHRPQIFFGNADLYLAGLVVQPSK
jgi:hypothetical protein